MAEWCIIAAHVFRDAALAMFTESSLPLRFSMDGNGVTPPTSSFASGGSQRSEGTNVVRVPFGVRRARRARPERPDHWATLVLPLQAGGGIPPTPPQAA